MLEIGHPLNFATLRDLSRGGFPLTISPAAYAAIDRGAAAVAQIVARGEPAYGVNTGFGRLAQTHIPNDQLELLQRNLVLSHAVGVGDPLPAGVVRLMLALKIATLARGYSGVRRELVDALVRLYNADVLPRVPCKGSVGASGDLAPLAHLSAVLLGIGEVECDGRILSAPDGLKRAGIRPVTFAAKEGLALLNGTQTSTALALWNLFAIDNLYSTALVAGALSVDAAEGSASPFDARIHELRGHPGQIAAAAAYRELLADSPINSSHRECGKVQDPYSLRCQPQVMGACSDQIEAARVVLIREANARHRQSAGLSETGTDGRGGIQRGALGRKFPRRAGGLRGRQSRARGRRNRRALGAAHRAADRRDAFGPAALPRQGWRREFRIHDRARHRGGAGFGEQTTGASRERGFAADLREPGRPRVHGDLRRAQARRPGGQHGDHPGHRAAGRGAGRRPARTHPDLGKIASA